MPLACCRQLWSTQLQEATQNQTFVVDASWLQRQTAQTEATDSPSAATAVATLPVPDPPLSVSAPTPPVFSAPPSQPAGDVPEGEEDESAGEESREPEYEEKIRLVGRILQKDVSVVSRPGKNLSMALDNPGRETVSLPPAEGFKQGFQKWQSEVEGSEGSRRWHTRPGEPLELRSFPQRKRIKLEPYAIAGRTWQQTPPPANMSLFESQLYGPREEPVSRVKAARVRGWEASARESITCLSYLDWFLSASKAELRNQADQLNQEEGVETESLQAILTNLTPEDRTRVLEWAEGVKEASYRNDLAMWTSLLEVIGLIESSARCAQDITATMIDLAGNLTLTRRDDFLERFNERLPREAILKLRSASVNEPKLFNEADLAAAKEVVEARKSAAVQDKFLAGPSKRDGHSRGRRRQEVGTSQGTAPPQPGPSGWKRRPFQRPFRGGHDGAAAPGKQSSRGRGRFPKKGGQ